jgi:KDO2-lipid IV(A) lauroyltransferase
MKNLKFLAISCLAIPLGMLPLRLSQALGSIFGRFAIRINKKRYRYTNANLKACFPKLNEQQRRKLIKQTAAEMGKWFSESTYVWFRDPQYLIGKTRVKNPELLEKAYRNNRGVVIVLPHFGNWEILNFYVPQNYPTGAMYKPIKSELMEELIFNGRSRHGTSMFSADTSGVRKALKHLKQGKVLVVLSDHLPSKNAGVYAPFFGLPAYTGKLAHSLVNYNQSEAVLAKVTRLPKGQGFEIEFAEISGMQTDNIYQATSAMNAAIEKAIRSKPEQYQWVYRRFGNQPKCFIDIYKKS